MNTSVNTYSKSQPKAGKYLLKKGSKMQQNESCIKWCTCSKKNAATLSKQTNMKKLLQSGWVQVESLQKNVAAESSNLCASFCWQPTLITASSYWVNFPIVRCRCWPLLQLKYQPWCYCIVRCIEFVHFRVKQPVHYKLVMKTYEVSCCFIW